MVHIREDVYAKFGEAAQLLEIELGNLLLKYGIAEENLVSKQNPERASELVDNNNRKTLGQLLHALKQTGDYPANLEQLLTDSLKDRNRLNHRRCYSGFATGGP